MMKRKSQAALEFLTTYGWAFLTIIIVIGALGYFGVLNPTKFLPERCIVTTGFTCDEFSAREAEGGLLISAVIKNSLQEAIEVQGDPASIEMSSDIILPGTVTGYSSDGSFGTLVGSDGNTPVSSIVINPDEDFQVVWIIKAADLRDMPTTGNKFKMDYTVTYTPVGGSLSRLINGEVFVAVSGSIPNFGND